MNRITLYVNGHIWIALYTGPHAAKIMNLFGAVHLPTAYTSITPGRTVATRFRISSVRT